MQHLDIVRSQRRARANVHRGPARGTAVQLSWGPALPVLLWSWRIRGYPFQSTSLVTSRHTQRRGLAVVIVLRRRVYFS